MKRDGRDTVASVLKENWGPKHPLAALNWWERRVAISHRALSNVPHTQVLELDLEALVVTDRESSYQRLLDFVGVKDSSHMRKYFDEEMPSQRLRIGKYRREIRDWETLDQAYKRVLARLNS
jgi:hypothetical protein